MAAYGLNPSSKLQALFRGMALPHQGQSPFKAQVIFVGIDANYSPEICANRDFFNRVLEYHEDGVEFWRRHGVHHPFLLPDYPLPKNTGGVPYHRKFNSMGLSPKFAEYISFVELLDVPTTGSTDRKIFWTLFNRQHAIELDNLFTDGSYRVVFLSNSVIGYMQDANKQYGVFDWLPMKCESGVFHQIGETAFYKAKHFSAAISREELQQIADVIRHYCLSTKNTAD